MKVKQPTQIAAKKPSRPGHRDRTRKHEFCNNKHKEIVKKGKDDVALSRDAFDTASSEKNSGISGLLTGLQDYLGNGSDKSEKIQASKERRIRVDAGATAAWEYRQCMSNH